MDVTSQAVSATESEFIGPRHVMKTSAAVDVVVESTWQCPGIHMT
jgi:hypothetical protein